MARHLTHAGYPDIVSLKGQDHDEVYANDCFARGVQVDRGALCRPRREVAGGQNKLVRLEGMNRWNLD
jgi:hypothetical protein